MEQTPRELIEPSARVRWRYLTPVAVLVLGLLSIAMLLWTRATIEGQTAQQFLFEDAITQLQVKIATSHLWLEEYLTEDPDVDIDQRLAELEEADDYLQHLIQGGAIEIGGEVIEPLADPELRRRAAEVKERLSRFRGLSVERRYLGGESAGIGSDIDQRYDQVFHDLLDASEELREALKSRWDRQQRRARLTLWAIVGAWILIVGAAGAGLWTRERQRQRSVDALRRSRRWLATTLTSIGDGVITTDLNGAVTFMNPVAERMTGWPEDEAAGRPIEEVFHVVGEDDEREVANPVVRVVRGHGHVEVTNHTLLVARDGARHFINHSAAPIQADPETLLGVVLVFRDVTQRRKAERALRAREIELREAQKMEAVGRLAGGIAHDINNYLGAIRGYCEVAKMKGESGEALARRMDGAIETTQSVSALIKQLLAFSRRQPVEPEVVDLNHVVHGLENMVRRLLGEDVTLTPKLGDDLWPIEIDPTQVEQILVNLLVNARDAMPTGGEITIATRNVVPDELDRVNHAVEPGRYALLTVADTGSGIDPAIREKIFEPFFTTKDDSGRSGLGLATVYGIVRQYGGSIVVESELGQGTAFKILLPACDGDAAARDDVVSPEAVADVGSLRVLLVEDNRAMRESTRGMLEALGHEVRVAVDGAEALRLLLDEAMSADLMITDVVMPGISGKELYDRLQEHRPDLRCLFISGYADQVTLQHGLSHDRVDFLAKPFGAAELAHKIAELV